MFSITVSNLCMYVGVCVCLCVGGLVCRQACVCVILITLLICHDAFIFLQVDPSSILTLHGLPLDHIRLKSP